jgi:hypothetical protein
MGFLLLAVLGATCHQSALRKAERSCLESINENLRAMKVRSVSGYLDDARTQAVNAIPGVQIRPLLLNESRPCPLDKEPNGFWEHAFKVEVDEDGFARIIKVD